MGGINKGRERAGGREGRSRRIGKERGYEGVMGRE